MKVNLENTEKIEEILREIEKKCTARIFGGVSEIRERISDLENTFPYRELPKNAWVGCTVTMRADGGRFPNAYKYRPETTIIKLERTTTGWFMTDCVRGNAECSERDINVLTLSDKAQDNLINILTHF